MRVRNLSYRVDDLELANVFKQFGHLVKAEVVRGTDKRVSYIFILIDTIAHKVYLYRLLIIIRVPVLAMLRLMIK